MGIQAPMAQGRSTKIITMIEWIQTRKLSIKNSLSYTEASHTSHRTAKLAVDSGFASNDESAFCDAIEPYTSLHGGGCLAVDSGFYLAGYSVSTARIYRQIR